MALRFSDGRAEWFDETLGYIPAIPAPFYVWQRWKWQKVKCQCGKTFITRDLGLLPREYEAHFALEHC